MRQSPRAHRAAMLSGIPLVMLTGLYLYAGRINGTPPPAAAPAATVHECGEANARRTAWFVAQDHLRSRLNNAPGMTLDGLEPGVDYAQRAQVIGGGQFRVEGWIELTSAAGARHQFLCELTRHADGTWVCDRLEIMPTY